MHRVTHLKILVTAQASEAIVREIPDCDHCEAVMRFDCAEAEVASMISRDIDEVVKNVIMEITKSPLSRIDRKFLKGLEAHDELIWSELQKELKEYGMQADMIYAGQRRSFITSWIAVTLGHSINSDPDDDNRSGLESSDSDVAEAELAESVEGSEADVTIIDSEKQAEPVERSRRQSTVQKADDISEKTVSTQERPVRRTPNFRQPRASARQGKKEEPRSVA